MPERRVRETLEELGRQIRAADTLTDEDRAELDRLVAAVETRLDRRDPSGAEPEEESPSLIHRLTEAAERFEASHPRLSAAVGRVVDALAALGI